MKHNLLLTILSLLSVLLFTLHVADDIVRGLDTAGPQNVFGVLILGVWLYGTLVLADRRSGYIIQLLGAILGLGVVVLHMKGAGYVRVATSSGGFFFVWALFALGASALLSLVLSVQGLWSLRRGQNR
jgi:hypothetical protein